MGVTIFVTTHYMDEAEHCDRLGFILDGRIIAIGSPSELKRTILGGDVFSSSLEDVFVSLMQRTE
jgi:ABC-2 type transport system ATP-binding protein